MLQKHTKKQRTRQTREYNTCFETGKQTNKHKEKRQCTHRERETHMNATQHIDKQERMHRSATHRAAYQYAEQHINMHYTEQYAEG